LKKSTRHYTKAIVVWSFAFAVFSAGKVSMMATPQGQQDGGVASPSPTTFECVLPYVSSGGTVNIVSASGTDEVVEITVMNAYRYNIDVPKNSSYSFEAPVFKGVFVPIVDGGPISFKSNQPIAVSTVLTESPVTVRCSELSQRTKLFVGSAKTRLALVNTTKSPMRVQFFEDNEQTPVSTLTIAAEDRKLAFLEELFPVSGTHAYRAVAGSDGFGLAVISGDRTAGGAAPLVENLASK